MEKPGSIDEKTSRLIEEMEKSLHKMEQSLGMDHPLVAKILDSYAQLLRKSNIRHLDALNMEARAKAIRAKQNQKEAKAQSVGLELQHQEKKALSVSQLRVISWLVSLVVIVALGCASLDIVKKTNLRINRKSEAAASKSERDLSDLPLLAGSDTEDSSGASASSADGSPDVSAAEPGAEKGAASQGRKGADDSSGSVTVTSVKRDPLTGQVLQKATLTTRPAADSSQLTVLEIAERIVKLKRLAREMLAAGLAAEKESNYPKATECYLSVIKAAQAAPAELGRPVYSEELAGCFEGYARMATEQSQPEIAREWKQAAADVRLQLSTH